MPPQGGDPWGRGGGMPPGGGFPPFGAPGIESVPQDQDAPFDQREGIGFVQAFIETWKRACLDPKTFFLRLKTTDITSAFLFAWIAGVIGNASAGFWSVLLALSQGQSSPETWAQLIGSPLAAAAAPWIGAGVIHVGCLIFGAGKRGFNATFRAVCYAQGPAILGVIPFVGTIVGSIWTFALLVTGVSLMQRTSTGRAVAAILIPAVLALCLFGCGLAAIFSAVGFTAFS